MRRICFLLIFFYVSISTSVLAAGEDRYLVDRKVFYEEPEEDEIVRVNTAAGYSTVLKFSERPTMVSAGDSSLLQVEIPKNSKNVLIKPLDEKGETNLFVFTPTQRFNYHVVIGAPENADYVLDVAQQYQAIADISDKHEIPIAEFLRMVQQYHLLKKMGGWKNRRFIQKDILTEHKWGEITVGIIDGFSYREPHYLALHIVIRNASDAPLRLSNRRTSLYINGKKFRPDYVLFDSQVVDSMKKTEGWLILRNTYVSLDNDFVVGLGIGDAEYVFD